MTNDKIMSTICDSICRHPYRVESQAELDILCEDCVVNKLEASDGDLISIDWMHHESVTSAEQVTGKLKKPCDSLLKSDSDERKEQKSKLESAEAVQSERTMTDLISRQDAIEACLAKAKRQHGVLYPEDIDNIIDSLPSAEAVSLEELDRIRTSYDQYIEQRDNAISEMVSDAVFRTSLPSASVEVGEYADRLWKIAYERGKDEAVQGDWIPCSERLPSEHGLYLVTYDDDIGMMWYGEPFMPNIKVNKGEKYFYRSDSEWGDIIYEEVTAWMPLPKPYEGSEGDE